MASFNISNMLLDIDENELTVQTEENDDKLVVKTQREGVDHGLLINLHKLTDSLASYFLALEISQYYMGKEDGMRL